MAQDLAPAATVAGWTTPQAQRSNHLGEDLRAGLPCTGIEGLSGSRIQAAPKAGFGWQQIARAAAAGVSGSADADQNAAARSRSR